MTVQPAALGRRDQVVPRVLAAASLVRLLAVLVGVAAMLARPLPLEGVVAIAALAGSSYAGISRRGAIALALRHPILSLLDVLLVLLVLALVGVDSPVVLATLSTALAVGLLQRPAAAWLVTTVLVCGYLLLWQAGSADGGSLTAALGTPLLYVSFVLIGFAVRSAQERQAEAERVLARALSETAGERERARLAREMHDSLAKTLHGLAMGASALPTYISCDVNRATEVARDLVSGIEQAGDEARALLSRMRADEPGALLGDVVRRRCEEWAERTCGGTEVTVATDGIDVACADVRYELLAVLAEALENVRRHAGARLVVVDLRSGPDGLRLTVQDDGVGIDRDAGEGRWGMVGMAERMEQVDGRLDVVSTRGQGTRVAAWVPPGRTDGRPGQRRDVGVEGDARDARPLPVARDRRAVDVRDPAAATSTVVGS